MNVRNVHERVFDVPAPDLAPLLDGLASPDDAFWPRHLWPAMKFDQPLRVGAVGGHGPIRYSVEGYEPGRRIRFRFNAPRGFHGTHRFEVEPIDEGRSRLRHILEMRTMGPAVLCWPIVFRPLHDALIEDALDRAELYVGTPLRPRAWSPWIRVLRWLLAGKPVRAR